MTTGKFNDYGSYIQLNTLEDKDKIVNDTKPTFLGTLPYRRCLCTRRDVVIVTVAFLMFSIMVTVSLILGLPALELKTHSYFYPPTYVSSSPIKVFDNASVIADGYYCAEIGKSMLEKGGHAVDAAVATLFCNGVVNPERMGLGGGFIMLIYNRETKKTDVVDARETAPAAATVNMFAGNATLSRKGGLAIATPGELRGYWDVHQKYGKLDWSTLIEPSIKICQDGFPVSEHMASKLKFLRKDVEHNEVLREIFINNETNELYKKNEIYKRPALAETLQIIAKEGAKAFYEGSLTKVLVDDIKQCGGIITEDDLKNYTAVFKDSITITLNDQFGSPKSLYTVPTPGCGPILSHVLLILDGYNISKATYKNWEQTVTMYHRVVEALKFGFAARMKLADDKEDATINELIKNLLAKKFADQVREKISDFTTEEPSFYISSDAISSNDEGTSHVNVLAPNGDAVAVTSTINSYFGSLCISSSTGVIFNNQMDDFSSPNITSFFEVPPSVVNGIKPGRRPLSSMSPSILINENGDVELVAGATGGTRIISTLVEAIMKILWLGENIKVATDSPRFHHQLIPNSVYYEEHFPQIYRDHFMKMGHILEVEKYQSEFLGILKRAKIQTNIDYRQSGSAAGF